VDDRRSQDGFALDQAALDQGLGGRLPGFGAHGLIELLAQQRPAPPQQAEELQGVVVEPVVPAWPGPARPAG
jgi:hypothetical protein